VVGRRLPVIDSSICVAVMTGLARLLALTISSFWNQGDPLDRHLTPVASAIMMPSAASRISSVCSKACERSIFARMKGDSRAPAAALADRADVGAALDERLADRVDSLPRAANFRHSWSRAVKAPIPGRCREVEPLARAQFAAVHHLAATSFPVTESTSSWMMPSFR